MRVFQVRTGFTSSRNPLPRSLRQPQLMQQLRRPKMPHPRQHNLVRATHILRRLRDVDVLRAKILQRLDDASEIPRLVINHGYHSKPFVLGSISRIRSSREQAPRSARANALKIASIL